MYRYPNIVYYIIYYMEATIEIPLWAGELVEDVKSLKKSVNGLEVCVGKLSDKVEDIPGIQILEQLEALRMDMSEVKKKLP